MKDKKSLLYLGIMVAVAVLAAMFLLNETNKAIAEINNLAAIGAK